MDSREILLQRIAENRETADRRIIPTPAERLVMLTQLRATMAERRDSIFTALHDDLGKSEAEAIITEYLPLKTELNYLIRKLPDLSRARRCRTSWWNFPAAGRIIPEPYGLVLVVSTWNYPLLLALEPVIGALAAGNRIVLKLSPRAPRTMHLVRWLLESALPPEFCTVIGDELSMTELLSEKFDYIFYTGNSAGGREVLANAAAGLTPATLELGGKNPCIVLDDADLRQSARRIVWGKFLNAGQTCIAPDYLLAARGIKDELVREMTAAIREFYGEEPLQSPDLARLCDAAAYERISRLSGRGRLLCGGEKNPETRAIAPTILDKLDTNDPLLTQEIFGPLLPVQTFNSEEELLARLCAMRGRPMAIYCFGGSRKQRQRLLRVTSSGAVVFDDVAVHFINSAMPFGGAGASGMGAYHGRRTFDTFSHFKPVMFRSRRSGGALRYPPFSGWRLRLLRWLAR